jgi:hypothetical protein
MTTPTAVPPAEQAPQQASTSALPTSDLIDPGTFVPQATRENYAQIARDQATARGVEPRQIMGELADEWETLHTRQPLDGYDHLAAWARTFDPGAPTGTTGLQLLVARTTESARRDPQQSVVGDQALVEQAVAVQTFRDEQGDKVVSTETTVLLQNAGPLPVPEDAAPQVDPAVAEQQQAAAAKLDEQPTTPPVDSPPPTDSGSGGSGGGSGSKRSGGSSG